MSTKTPPARHTEPHEDPDLAVFMRAATHLSQAPTRTLISGFLPGARGPERSDAWRAGSLAHRTECWHCGLWQTAQHRVPGGSQTLTTPTSHGPETAITPRRHS